MSHANALDYNAVRANARVWRRRGEGRLRAVVKSDGYGWGLTQFVRELEPEVDGFCVLDLTEFHAIRAHTQKPVTILGFCPPADIAELLADGALPNIATLAQLEAAIAFAESARRMVRIRAGISPALGWNGVAAEEQSAFAARAGAHALLELELWTHVTAPEIQSVELAEFEAFLKRFEHCGARIAGIDVANSSALASGIPQAYRSSRIGIGLFGAFRSQVPALRTAITLAAPVVERRDNSSDLVAGYARRALPPARFVETLRIGYGDGLPRGLVGAHIATPAGNMTIATIGMQHTVVAHDLAEAPMRTLLHPHTDVHALCAGTTTSAHELVVGLGIASATRR